MYNHCVESRHLEENQVGFIRALVAAMRRIRTRPTGLKLSIIVLLLLVGLIYQVWALFPQVMVDLTRIRKDLGQSGLWRSANYSQNQKFANYIKFLNENIPRDARVILPVRHDEDLCCGATSTPFMQFFLAPREVLNCLQPLEVCIAELSDGRTYFLVLDSDAIQRSQDSFSPSQLVLFDQSWSLIRPENPREGLSTPLPAFQRFEDLIPAVAFPAVWLATLVIAGFPLSKRLIPDIGWAPGLAIGCGLALGFLSFSLFVLMLLGFSLSRLLIVAVTLAWLISALLAPRALHKQGKFVSSENKFAPVATVANLSHSFWLLLLVLLGLLSTILSVGKAYHFPDSILIWGAKGYGIAIHGLVAGASAWGTTTLRYPLHIPLLIATFKVLFTEILPASKLIFPLYYLGLIVMIYSRLAARVPEIIAGLATLILATAPIPFRYSQVAYANLPFTFYFVSAALILSDAFDPADDHIDHRRLFLAGLFFTLSAWTRPEGLPVSALVILSIIVVATKQGARLNWRILASVITPLAVFALIWYGVSDKVYVNRAREDNLIPIAINQITRGNLHLSEAGYVLKYSANELFDKSSWGSIGMSLALLVILAITVRGIRHPSRLLLAGFVFVASIWGLYFLTSFDDLHDVSWWVSTGLNRMILPGIALVWAGLIENLFDNGETYRTISS